MSPTHSSNSALALQLHASTKVATCVQKAQVQPRGSEVHVISNWNGTVELPAYDFGDQVLQEGSFGEAFAPPAGEIFDKHATQRVKTTKQMYGCQHPPYA